MSVQMPLIIMFTDSLNLPIKSDRSKQQDQILILPGMTWEDYEQLVAAESSYLISYFDNQITIVSPSPSHERLSRIALILIDAYCVHFNIKSWALGSTDLKKAKVAGKQPDESFDIGTYKGTVTSRDLAIEINYTSGSFADLDKYKEFQVKEVWLWEQYKIHFYSFDGSDYQLIEVSHVLEKLSSNLVNKFVNLNMISQDDGTIKAEFLQALDPDV